MRISRRAAILTAGATALVGTGAVIGEDLAQHVPDEPPLKLRAARKGLDYGCMVDLDMLARADLMRAIARQSATVVPGRELKWSWNQPRPGAPTYADADRIFAFGATHGMKLRGHTAFWYMRVPDWAKAQVAAPGGVALILARVTAVVGHYRGRVFEWDVVNEAVEPKDGQPGGLRLAPFGRPVGPGWIADCFHAARAADPKAALFYNDYSLEHATPYEESRRVAVLGLLQELKRRGAPVDGLGIQSHVGVGRPFDAERFRGFLRDVAALGLRVRLTEFDVADNRGSDIVALRDRQVADHARRFLDAAFDEPAVCGLVSWGYSDTEAWQRCSLATGICTDMRPRPLLIDDQLQRKPLWYAVAKAFDDAPVRRA